MSGIVLQLGFISMLLGGIFVGVIKIRKNTDQILVALRDAKERKG